MNEHATTNFPPPSYPASYPATVNSTLTISKTPDSILAHQKLDQIIEYVNRQIGRQWTRHQAGRIDQLIEELKKLL